MRSFFLTLAFSLLSFSYLAAKIVEKELARAVATNFLTERIANQQVKLSLGDVDITFETTLTSNGEPAIYIFSNSGEGFLLISADDALVPVLGYSATGTYPEKGKSPGFDSFVEELTRQVRFVRDQPDYHTMQINNGWELYLTGTNYFTDLSTNDIEPLMTNLWNQDFPYNALCPEDEDGPGGHVYAGCVATAMSMIMYYYRYPLQGIGTHTYYAMGYGTQSVNYGTTFYDWDGMIDQINGASGQCIPAIAQLQYHAGVSVNMQYSPTGSGAYSVDVPAAMISHFGYATSTQYQPRSSYTASQWETMVVGQLDELKPIYYSGHDPTPGTGGGHAWICDGYQVTGSTKMFHFNFGWGGYGNGYYTLANPFGFTTQQGMVRNAVPATNYPYGCSAKTITVANGSFEDGSSLRLNYDPNSNCTWLIDPADSVNTISLSFISFDVDPSDSLYIFDGADDNAALLGAFSGNSLPPGVNSTGGKMFLKFITDASAEAAGWVAEFHSVYPQYCSGTATLTTPTGTISDGSGNNNYNNNAICKWKIQPPYATDLTLTFTDFDLEENDELLVYATGSSTILLATLTGNQLPDPIVSPTSALLLMFKANGYDPAGGFDGYYTTSNVGTKDLTGVSGLTVSPNPATSYTVLRFINQEGLDVNLAISDMTGKQLYSGTINGTKGNIEETIRLDSFIPGMYILSIQTTKGKVSRKLVIK